jgi:hypothetical protein
MKNLLLCALLAALPAFSQATDINIDGSVTIKSGNATLRIGDQDKRGYYWDGKYWRDPDYWHQHHGNNGVGSKCPPGQAKKGRC